MLGHLYSFIIMDINEQDISRLILTNDIDSAKKLINHYSAIVPVNNQKQNLNDAWKRRSSGWPRRRLILKPWC